MTTITETDNYQRITESIASPMGRTKLASILLAYYKQDIDRVEISYYFDRLIEWAKDYRWDHEN